MNNNYSRRKFLKTVVISAGAAGATGLAGCGGESRNLRDATIEVTGVDTNGSLFPQSVASGDPRTSSIILWTRLDAGTGEKNLSVQISKDEDFSNLVLTADLTANFANDHCVKVKITDLSSGTRFYYRFVYEGTSSRTGRFKTAPKSSSDKNVKFGFISCQDYTNGYYNSLLKFLEQGNDDIDFIVHLGDYIYETTRDDFQAPKAGREVTFTDTAGAIDRSPTETDPSLKSYAAQSLSNYRELYKTYRTDPVLQRIHELFPFICIWDDHEFSDDSWGNNATYTSGLALDSEGNTLDENTDRKKNAEKAFFEFMPLDIDPVTGSILSDGQVEVDRDQLYQSNIYRSFRYGKNLNLMMTDFRTFRPDHVIPEDAYPGSLAMTQYEVGQVLYQNNRFNFVATVKAAGGTLPTPYDPDGPDTQDLASDEPYPWSDPTRVTDADKAHVANEVTGLVTAGTLPLLPYVDIDSVSNANFLNFIATVDGTFRAIEANPALTAPEYITGFLTTPGTGNLREFLIYILTLAYQTPSSSSGITVSNRLTQTQAQEKAVSVATGNLNVNAINATLVSFYDTLLIVAAPILDDIGIVFDATPSADGSLTQTQRDNAFATLAAGLGQPGFNLTRLLPDGVIGSDDNNPLTCEIGPDGANAASVELATLTTDPSWGFRGFGVPWALMGKTSFAGSFGSRYLVVKDTYDLYSGFVLTALTDTYRSITHANIPASILALDVGDAVRRAARSAADDAAQEAMIAAEGERFRGFGNPWGDAQQTGIMLNLTSSSATWNVLGSSVSFTSLILDYRTDYTALGFAADLRSTLIGAAEFCIESPDDESTRSGVLPEARFYMNVDHWDGFPQTRTTLINNSTGKLPAGVKSLQDSNTVIISGDIHATFVTDHGANTSGTGRCLEFTVPAVSSGSFGSFTNQALTDFGLPGALADTVVNSLGSFLQQAAIGDATVSDQPQDIEYANPLQNGVAIMSLSSGTLSVSIHHLPTDTDATLLSQAFQNYTSLTSLEEFRAAAAALSGTFISRTYSSNKEDDGSGNLRNSALS